MRTPVWKLLAFFLLITPASIIWAQSAAANGAISGAVVDPQGSAVVGAQVILRHNELAVTRTVTTNDAGSFTAPALPAGAYSVQVRAPGFTLAKPPRITLNAGSSVRVTLKLSIAATSQEVVVTGRGATVEGNTVTPTINKDEPSVSNTIAGLTVTYLPNRNRDFSQFGQLGAGVSPDQNSAGLVFAGQRASDSKEAVDGGDFNDPLQGGPRGARDGSFFFPQTVVREFQVVHAGNGADVGGTNAGFINIVTKSGSNKLHGEAFYIGRPPLFTSHDAFGHPLDNQQNEFGGSVGGPLRKDRAFFYVGAEQDYLQIPYWTQFEPQAIAVPAFLAALQQQTVESTHPTALFGRVDLLPNSSNTLDLQVNYNHIHATDIDSGSTRTIAAKSNSASLTGNSTWLRANLATVFGPATVNQVLAQWSRDTRNRAPDDSSPELFINGFGILGGNSFLPDQYTSESRRISDDISLSSGARLLRFGLEFADDPARELHEADLNGRFDFTSLSDFLNDLPRRYQQTLVTGDAQYRGAVRELGIYVTGKLQVRRNITATAGLRWQGQWNPQPNNPNGAIPQTVSIPNDLSQWQPRLGIAWNPMSATVVRFSSGLYDALTPADIFQRVFTDNGVNTIVADSFFDPAILPLVTTPGSAFHALPALPTGLSTPDARIVGISPAFHNPRSFQLAASIEQQIGGRLTLSTGYVRNSTWDLQQSVDRNLNPPLFDATATPIFPLLRPDPAIGRLIINESSAHASYNGLLVTATVQLPKRSQLAANYTLSRTRDNNSSGGPFSIDSVLNPFNLAGEAAYSSQDIRNNFNLSGVINLWWGMKFNPVVVAHSGAPYTPIIGFDRQNDANDWNDRAIIQGNVAPRNIFRQPSFFDFDVRLVKDITLRGEGHHLDLFMDIFNITRATHRNFGPDSVSLFGTPSAPYLSAGQPLFAPDTTGFGSARQIQFTARIVAF